MIIVSGPYQPREPILQRCFHIDHDNLWKFSLDQYLLSSTELFLHFQPSIRRFFQIILHVWVNSNDCVSNVVKQFAATYR